MPAKRKYATAGERQAAYRARCRSARDSLMASKSIPSLPPIPTMPGYRRCEAMLEMAFELSQSVLHEMQDYFDDRSEPWHDSDKAEAFIERMDEIAELIGVFDSLPKTFGRQNTQEDTNAY